MTHVSRIAALVLVGLMVLTVGCSKQALNTFENGTYTGSVGQTLVISGDNYTYTVAGMSLSGNYVISGTTVTFVTTAVGGQGTGIEQKATYDFTSTSNSIALSNMRDLVNGGSGIAADTFTK